MAGVGLKLVKDILELEPEIRNLVSRQKVEVLLQKFVTTSQQIESTIRTESQRIIDELSLEVNMQRVHSFKIAVDDINLRYGDDFYKYFMSNITYERETMERFVNDRDVFKQLIRSIRYHIVPTNIVAGVKDDRLFEILHDYLLREANNNRHCELGISHYKILYETYNTAVSAVVKATVMILYSYKYLQQGDHDAWEAELRDVRTDYVQTVASISAAARAVMARSSRAVSRCDPRIYIRGSNYINYSFRILYVSIGGAMRLAEKKYVRPWPRTEIFCYGTVSDCTQRRVIKGCLAAPGSGRRYKAIIERGGFLDFSWYYKGPIISESECDSDPMIPDLMYYNNYACICTEPSTIKKNAYLNKTAVYSDVANNRVITGIRFRTRWAITYLEVQEGEMVNGSVLPQSVRWREDVTRQLEDYERRHYVLPDDFELGKNDEYVALPDGVVNPNFDSNIVNLRRADVNFNLDDIILPAGMVVTGVRFTQLLNGGIALMVEGSKAFDDIGNFKFSSERQWFSNTNYLRNPIILNDHDNPLDGPKQNKELSTPGRSSIALQLSDWTRDGRQSLIPFIDLQQVVTSPPSPIGGLGIFYKGQKNYGGFISLRIFDIDNTMFMFSDRLRNERKFEWFNNTQV